MADTIKTYRADAKLARLIEEVARSGEKLRIVTEDSEYDVRVALSDDAGKGDIWANYDPERAREALRQTAGILKGIDAEELVQQIRSERGQAGWDDGPL